MAGLRLALAQVNPTVGALEENRSLLEAHLKRARELGARLVLFPELVLTGYPPEDLLRADAFLEATRRELLSLLPATRGLLAVVGLPIREGRDTYNAAALLLDGRWVDTYAKGTLPNYGVFDEKRYFRPGLRCPVHHWGDLTFGINICEDLWAPQGVPAIQTREGARLLLNLSSSPSRADKGRERAAARRARPPRRRRLDLPCPGFGSTRYAVLLSTPPSERPPRLRGSHRRARETDATRTACRFFIGRGGCQL